MFGTWYIFLSMASKLVIDRDPGPGPGRDPGCFGGPGPGRPGLISKPDPGPGFGCFTTFLFFRY